MGGKAVIIGDPAKIKSRELFHAFGKFVDSLGGRYITAEDMNTTTQDIDYIHEVTDRVVGLESKRGNPARLRPMEYFAVCWLQ